MLLIADSGSTKTDWILMDGKKSISRCCTIGYNPLFINSEAIYLSISQELVPKMDLSSVKKVFFYGADCSSEENIAIVHKALTKCFINSEVFVGHDLLAASRALLGNSRGFAAIIGTGSNSCIYNGEAIEKNIKPLGYLLGDEGSGSHIGKKIVRDHMRGFLPAELELAFTHTYPLKDTDIFDQMYNKPFPNRFLSGFCKFAHTHQKHPYVERIVKESFNDFFLGLVSRYPGHEQYHFNCSGSVGFIFQDALKEVAALHKMKTGKIIASPIEDLAAYHLKAG